MTLDELIKAVEKRRAGYILTFNETGNGKYNLWCYDETKRNAADKELAYDAYRDKHRTDFEGKTIQEVFKKALQYQPK